MLLFDCGVPLSERTGHQLPLFAFQLFAVQLVRRPEHKGENNWRTGGLYRSLFYGLHRKELQDLTRYKGKTANDGKITIRGI